MCDAAGWNTSAVAAGYQLIGPERYNAAWAEYDRLAALRIPVWALKIPSTDMSARGVPRFNR
jgi:hypothetical protein